MACVDKRLENETRIRDLVKLIYWIGIVMLDVFISDIDEDNSSTYWLIDQSCNVFEMSIIMIHTHRCSSLVWVP
jgi:hypothetical protein